MPRRVCVCLCVALCVCYICSVFGSFKRVAVQGFPGLDIYKYSVGIIINNLKADALLRGVV